MKLGFTYRGGPFPLPKLPTRCSGPFGLDEADGAEAGPAGLACASSPTFVIGMNGGRAPPAAGSPPGPAGAGAALPARSNPRPQPTPWEPLLRSLAADAVRLWPRDLGGAERAGGGGAWSSSPRTFHVFEASS